MYIYHQHPEFYQQNLLLFFFYSPDSLIIFISHVLNLEDSFHYSMLLLTSELQAFTTLSSATNNQLSEKYILQRSIEKFLMENCQTK